MPPFSPIVSLAAREDTASTRRVETTFTTAVQQRTGRQNMSDEEGTGLREWWRMKKDRHAKYPFHGHHMKASLHRIRQESADEARQAGRQAPVTEPDYQARKRYTNRRRAPANYFLRLYVQRRPPKPCTRMVARADIDRKSRYLPPSSSLLQDITRDAFRGLRPGSVARQQRKGKMARQRYHARNASATK